MSEHTVNGGSFVRDCQEDVGILDLEIYFPSQFVDQAAI
jgi:hypothetical protein